MQAQKWIVATSLYYNRGITTAGITRVKSSRAAGATPGSSGGDGTARYMSGGTARGLDLSKVFCSNPLRFQIEYAYGVFEPPAGMEKDAEATEGPSLLGTTQLAYFGPRQEHDVLDDG